MTTQPFKALVLDFLQQGHADEAAFLQGLSETERDANGTPDLWSSKDHVVHRSFWHRNLVQQLTAILQQQEVPQLEGSDDEINARVFAEQRLRPWSEVHAASEQVFAELVRVTEQLSEDDLAIPGRFSWRTGERPLYTVFLGPCYEHDQEHLAQYYSDRHDLPRATEIRERCVARILEADVPDRVKGSFLYNLACFYALQHQAEQAAPRLQEALRLAPDLAEWSKSDPDLAALRDPSA